MLHKILTLLLTAYKITVPRSLTMFFESSKILHATFPEVKPFHILQKPQLFSNTNHHFAGLSDLSGITCLSRCVQLLFCLRWWNTKETPPNTGTEQARQQPSPSPTARELGSSRSPTSQAVHSGSSLSPLLAQDHGTNSDHAKVTASTPSPDTAWGWPCGWGKLAGTRDRPSPFP